MKRCEFRVILNVKYFTWRIELQQHLQHVRASRRCGGVKNRSSVGGITYRYWWTLRQNLSQCNHIIPFNTSKYVQRPWNVLKSLAGTFEIWIVAWVSEDEKEYHVNLEDGWYFYIGWWRYQYIRFSCRSSTWLSLSRRSGLFRTHGGSFEPRIEYIGWRILFCDSIHFCKLQSKGIHVLGIEHRKWSTCWSMFMLIANYNPSLVVAV